MYGSNGEQRRLSVQPDRPPGKNAPAPVVPPQPGGAQLGGYAPSVRLTPDAVVSSSSSGRRNRNKRKLAATAGGGVQNIGVCVSPL